MENSSPNPNQTYPIAAHQRVCFIKNVVKAPNITIGDYTYYDDPIEPEGFERNVLYNFGDDKLIIGKFCSIATNVKFIMSGANHKLDGISTYPFPIFGHGWDKAMDKIMNLPSKGDTIIGNDVWLGYESVIMPGVKIGHGAIIAAKSVVTSDIPDFAIAGGNPARIIKQRFSDSVIAQLLEIKWWDWEIEKITRNIDKIMEGDISALRDAK
ncbi:MAG TPA: Vat family streptogramin A O-acetyltransferase [Cyanobacteria bacterium UBA11149]|nr:Vat family streptogramin A O-acetyltransferase [Cyanobacteria bacterium UBA11367]HBE60717.1 Vat family streptogramin A O-acetyltransferase [Cyanobacteria bacterium UBA11366]HBK64024.1 Vat family streptogramin A O-acetyltransferase [Cyanobacteria bacterium UBA11166]HBR74485.1 Vat family streptogramin A O-acetyltransferase [Cyanobacteria bacterium UBA11159]HBS68283.1 Vat family streptogramin A O-acetyltransferase [Cyanobacteria bacterium UBA11153]HBW91376.1 Vat family streptogramin A O-acetyl